MFEESTMKTLITTLTLCVVIYAGKGAIYDTISVKNTHDRELNKALTLLDK